MDYQYKVIISNRTVYKEFEIPTDMEGVRLGTTSFCEFRLNPESFFGDIEIEFTELDNELNLAKEKLRKAEFLKILYLAILELNSLPTNFVSKTSIEFGIFFNKEKTNDYKNYIKYHSPSTSLFTLTREVAL